MDMGAHARAAHAAELALALAPRVSDPALVAGMHRGVARTLIAEGRIAEADASLAKAQELYRQLHIRTELAHCHWMRGYVHAQDGDLEHAESELRTARSILASKRAALFTEQVEVELADVLRRRGKAAKAEALLRPLLASRAVRDGAGEGSGSGALGVGRGAVHAGGALRLLGADRRRTGRHRGRRGALLRGAVPARTVQRGGRLGGSVPPAGGSAAPYRAGGGGDGRVPHGSRAPCRARHDDPGSGARHAPDVRPRPTAGTLAFGTAPASKDVPASHPRLRPP